MNCQYFFDFVDECNGDDDGMVDVSTLIELYGQVTPQKAVLNQDDLVKTFRLAGYVIIKNFCFLYHKIQFFPLEGLKKLAEILRMDAKDQATQAKLSLLVHLTKSEFDPATFTNFIKAVATMTIVTEFCGQILEWQSAARSSVNHSQIQEVIGAAISKLGYTCKQFSNVNVTFVVINKKHLRGFAGVDTIYLNTFHFHRKIAENPNIDPSWMKQLIEIDIMTVTIHEFAHVLFRQTANDFNISTPPLAKSKGFEEKHLGLGRSIECEIFGKSIDWIESYDMVPRKKVFEIVSAIRNGTTLHDYKKMLMEKTVGRTCSTLFGFDFQENPDLF